MRYWYDEEHDMKMCEPDCVDEWLFDIWAIGCDYDGCHTTKDLKKLVDELVSMTNKARECLWERHLFGSHGEPRKPQTNADRIRSMSDEELAEMLLDGCRGSRCSDQPHNDYGSVDCFKCRMEWLKQLVKDGEDE